MAICLVCKKEIAGTVDEVLNHMNNCNAEMKKAEAEAKRADLLKEKEEMGTKIDSALQNFSDLYSAYVKKYKEYPMVRVKTNDGLSSIVSLFNNAPTFFGW